MLQWLLDQLLELGKIVARLDERLNDHQERISKIESINADRRIDALETAHSEAYEQQMHKQDRRPSWWMVTIMAISTLVAIAATVVSLLAITNKHIP